MLDMLIRQERFVTSVGPVEHVLLVEEQIRGPEAWPERFRIQLCAVQDGSLHRIYGATSREVVERAIEYLYYSMPNEKEPFALRVC